VNFGNTLSGGPRYQARASALNESAFCKDRQSKCFGVPLVLTNDGTTVHRSLNFPSFLIKVSCVCMHVRVPVCYLTYPPRPLGGI